MKISLTNEVMILTIFDALGHFRLVLRLGLMGLLIANNVITLSPPLLNDVAEGHWEVAVEHSTVEINPSLHLTTSDSQDAFPLELALFSQNWRSSFYI